MDWNDRFDKALGNGASLEDATAFASNRNPDYMTEECSYCGEDPCGCDRADRRFSDHALGIDY